MFALKHTYRLWLIHVNNTYSAVLYMLTTDTATETETEAETDRFPIHGHIFVEDIYTVKQRS